MALAGEHVFDGLDHHLPGDPRDRPRERDSLGAGLYAILGIAAFVDAAIAHKRMQAFFFEDRTGGMVIEQCDLRYRGCSNKSCVFIELWANFHADSAGYTVGEWISLFLLLWGDAGAGTEVIGSVHWYPGFDLLEVLE